MILFLHILEYIIVKPLLFIIYSILKVLNFLCAGILAGVWIISGLIRIMVGIYILGIIFNMITDENRIFVAVCGAIFGVAINVIINTIVSFLCFLETKIEIYLFPMKYCD